jgi:type IV fimbrial biogenesis protein FimT
MQSIKQSGVTLVELMVVVTIAGILAAAAAPSLSGMISGFRQTSLMSLIMGDVYKARGEAIKRNQRILMCVPNATATACGAGTSWNAGWLICYNANEDGVCDSTTATNPNPILIRPAINSGFTLTGTNLTSQGGATFVQFNPNGTQGTGSTTVTLAISGVAATTATSTTVYIAATGTPSK